jgi:hypothetical protein
MFEIFLKNKTQRYVYIYLVICLITGSFGSLFKRSKIVLKKEKKKEEDSNDNFAPIKIRNQLHCIANELERIGILRLECVKVLFK